jgi:two-component system phosphate regulon response regulator PhoB
MTSTPERAPLVLVVEDEAELHDLLRSVIEDAVGAKTVTASSAEEALELIPEHLPDLVLLDLALPRMSGIDLCRVLKDSSTTRHIPVIAFTAAPWGYETTYKRALDAGCDGFVHKLYNFHHLEPLLLSYLHPARSFEIAEPATVSWAVADTAGLLKWPHRRRSVA